MGGGNRLTGRRGPLGRRLECFGFPPYHCCGPAFDSIPGLTSGRTDKNLCRCFGAPALPGFP